RYGAASVAVKVEPIAIDVLYCELPQPPRLPLDGIDDAGTHRAQFLIRCVQFRRENPVNRRFKRSRSSAKEDREVVTRNSTDISAGLEPSNLKAQCIPVVSLRTLHVLHGELRRGMSELRARFRVGHDHWCFSFERLLSRTVKGSG